MPRSKGNVLVAERTQAESLPSDVRQPEESQKVEIRAIGNEGVIAPLGQTWDSFFLGGPPISADFLPERGRTPELPKSSACLPAFAELITLANFSRTRSKLP
jgi:antitoxin VapB